MTSVIELLKMFYNEGFFKEDKGLKDVRNELKNRGFNFSDQLICGSLMSAPFLSRSRKLRGNNKFAQREPPQSKIKEEKRDEINKVLSELTEKKLGERFQQDIRELNASFTHDCGNSTAFLLRKILEKAIFYVFVQNGNTDSVKGKDGKILGLDALLDLCKREKIKGEFILLPKTVDEIHGLKFLGDSAAHDYLADIELHDLNHQLPIWTMALKQLINKLKK